MQSGVELVETSQSIDVEVGKEQEEEDSRDFTKDEVLLKHVNRSRYIILDIYGVPILRMNWVVSLLASIVLWAVVGYCIDNGDEAVDEFTKWQSWVTQNFTWLYIGSQDVWAVFLAWLCFSKYGNIKLGRDEEKPKFDDITWFAMLFACGIGVGLYYWSVSEPIYYYTGYSNMMKPYNMNADTRAQQAIFLTYFHWGLHGWVVYIVVAIALGLVCFRQGHPLSMRYCFKPLVGDKVIKGIIGDLIDALSITCTTYGVCTSLGLGVESIATGLDRIDSSLLDPTSTTVKIWIVIVITFIATLSVLSGLHVGIKYLSLITFAIGNIFLIMILFLDNTWYQLNVVVQSIGFYLQHVVEVGFQCDAWQQLNYELDASKENLLVGSNGPNSLLNRLADEDITMNHPSPTDFYDQSPTEFMDWWTVFYWGWWISWAPFVGLFVAMISRGRTIRNVVFGAFFAPCLFTFVWFGIFGSLGIKMQRVAELVLVPENSTASVYPDCASMGYSDGQPVSDAAQDLADMGYYPLNCRAHAGRIFDIVEPYSGMRKLMYFLIFIGVSLYFITSSDSGSFVDDLISANGHENPPAIQKVYWCWTEGLTAIALIKAGGSEAIYALRAVSICSGLPYTLAICFLCTAIYRCVKMEMGDKDILESAKWDVDVFDAFAGFDTTAPTERVARWVDLLVDVVFPGRGIRKAMVALYGKQFEAIGASISMTLLYYTWILLMLVGYSMAYVETGNESYRGLCIGTFGWVFYIGYIVLLACLRTEFRAKKKIYGSIMEDFFTTMMMPMFVVNQLNKEKAD